MDAPKCPICGKRHRSYEPHDFGGDKSAESAPETPPEPTKPAPQDDPVKAYERQRKAAWRERNREAYNARQRALMRHRRGLSRKEDG